MKIVAMPAPEESTLGGYGRTVVWLRDHGLNTQQIARLFDTSAAHIRQLEFRAKRRSTSAELFPSTLLFDSGIWSAPKDDLRRLLGVRTGEDNVEPTPRASRRTRTLEIAIEGYATEFWEGVRYEAGIERLRALLPQVGYPSQFQRIRLCARIHELCSETYLHSGSSASALAEGLRAYQLFRVAYHESGDSYDLSRVSRMSRLLSQIFLLRREPELTSRYLELHLAAQQRLKGAVRPEYHHQLAILAFCSGDPSADPYVRQHLRLSMQGLEQVASHGETRQLHEIRDIGERHLGLLTPINWEASLQLCREQLACYPSRDIHVGLNVATAAACALSTDYPVAHAQGLDLLDKHARAASGFRRLETNFMLLRLTPRLPERIRAQWTRFALYENSFDHRDRFPRYTKAAG
jgi:hypothetical protein